MPEKYLKSKIRNRTGIYVFLFSQMALRSNNGFQLIKRKREQQVFSV